MREMKTLLASAVLVASVLHLGPRPLHAAAAVPVEAPASKDPSDQARNARLAGGSWPLAEPGVAFLDVSSDPVAKILIDETDTGKVTPEPHLVVKPGRHKLTLVTLDGGRVRTLGFAIEAGETRKFTVHLAR
jgi:hypothetical protein